MFTRFLKTALSILNSIYKSNLSTCIVDMENVEPFIFGDAFLNFVWFETFAQTPFFDLGHFQVIWGGIFIFFCSDISVTVTLHQKQTKLFVNFGYRYVLSKNI